MSMRMSAVLVLWLMCGFLANLPTAFSRPPLHGSESGSGIEADETAKRQSSVGCGGFNYANNTLTSPGYPSYYPNSKDCEYWVPIPAGMAMNITFILFDMENQAACGWDYLKITNENNQTFGTYCGVKTGINVTVTGDYVVLKFHSDSSVNRPGYLLTFNAFSNTTQPPPSTFPTPTAGNATYPPWFTTAPPNGSCGYVQNNTLTSPGYPNYYPHNTDCNYWIYIPHGKDLRIYFDYFRVNDCGYDYLKITNENGQTFGSFCGYRSGHVVIVTGHYAVVTFHSDSSVNDRGYRLLISSQGIATTSAPYTTPPYQNATYPPWNATTPPVGCGYVQNYELTSPGYPNYYPHNMDCNYWIYIPYGKDLRIYFDYFRVNDCGYDYLKITNENNQTFGSFCGYRSGHVVIVTGYYAVVTFHSDGSVNDQGYKLFISYVSQGNFSTSTPWPPYTTYRPYTRPSRPYPSYYPSADPKCKLQTYIRILQIVLDEMENVVDNALPSKFSVRDYRARVKRALVNVHTAMSSGGRQKRDVRKARMVDELEKRAAELMKRLDAKEAQYKRRALLNKKIAKRAPIKAY